MDTRPVNSKDRASIFIDIFSHENYMKINGIFKTKIKKQIQLSINLFHRNEEKISETVHPINMRLSRHTTNYEARNRVKMKFLSDRFGKSERDNTSALFIV